MEAFKVTNSAACTLCLNAARDDPVWGAAYFEELLKTRMFTTCFVRPHKSTAQKLSSDGKPATSAI
jgi:hypothetical protein